MRKSVVTYAQLDSVLQALGFSVRINKGKHRLYTHQESGAVMSLPDARPGDAANATYVAAVRKVVTDYEIADDVEFTSRLGAA